MSSYNGGIQERRILITNEDGIKGEGLNVLKEIWSTKHDVWVIAPSENKSAAASGITLTSPLQLRPISNQIFTCSGLPVDCASIAMGAIMSPLPDVVISGINEGANIGTDINYSGTVAAARQASLLGVKGIAISLDSDDGSFTGKYDYKPLATFLLENLENFVALCVPDSFININAVTLPSYKGWKKTVPAKRKYDFKVSLSKAPDVCDYTFVAGGKIETTKEPDTDYEVIHDGYVSVSRIHSQPIAVPWED